MSFATFPNWGIMTCNVLRYTLNVATYIPRDSKSYIILAIPLVQIEDCGICANELIIRESGGFSAIFKQKLLRAL